MNSQQTPSGIPADSKGIPSGLSANSQRTPIGLPADSQRTPSGLQADSQWTLPADTPSGHSQWTPSGLQQISSKADSKQVSVWRAHLESFFWRAHFESCFGNWWYSMGKSDPQQTSNKVLIGPHKTQPRCNLETSF